MHDPTFVVYWRWAWLGVIPALYLTAVSSNEGFFTGALIAYGGAGLAAAVTGNIGFPAATRGALWWIAIMASVNAKYLPLWEMWVARGPIGLWTLAYVFVGPFAVIVLGASLDPVYKPRSAVQPGPDHGKRTANSSTVVAAAVSARNDGEHFRLGVALLERGEPKAVLDEFHKSVAEAIGDQKADSLYNIAICNARIGDVDAAVKATAQAIALDPALAQEMATDPDFAPLQKNESFQETLRSAGSTLSDP